ncbi:sensor histidine kinase [Nocardia sp. NPDC058058]|uniref:sensor histidine kinase n=1 Tax=Nocardia sp. NPDC058058 TaxID=3346317 RepID=UPI0036DC9C47
MTVPARDGVSSVATAMLTGPRYLLTAWPLRAVVGNILAGMVSAVLMVALIPLLLVGITANLRTAIWTPVLELEAARLALIDPEMSDRVRGDTRAAMARGGFPALRHLAYLMFLTVVIGPAAFCLTVFMLGLDTVLLAAPWLLDDRPISVLWWRIETMPQAWIAMACGALAVALTAYLHGLLAAAGSALAGLTLVGDSELRREVVRLTDSRAALLEAVEQERRRIEAELHDRVQHRLVALAVTLGIAEAAHGDNDTGKLAAQAHQQLDAVLAELRSVILGVQPRALSEHGLAAAVTDLVGHCPLPVHVDLRNTQSPNRLPAAVEQTGYLVITESLTNIMKHSDAHNVTISADRTRSAWRLSITDDGRGGASAVPGHGLDSLISQVAAIDGMLTITSPPGGPTEIAMRCPLPKN